MTKIFRHASGKWAACPTIEGTRRWFYGETKHEVEEQMAEAKYLAKRGRLVAPNKVTVRKYLSEWLDGSAAVRLRPQSLVMYRVHCRRIEEYVGDILLVKLTARHLQSCYGELAKRGLSATTIRTTNAVLHAAFEAAVKRDFIVRNPASGVDLPKAERMEMHTLTREQVRTLLRETEGTPWHALWALLVSTGLRRSEAVGLKWSDLDEVARTLVVTRQVVRHRGQGLVLGPLKTPSSYRTISLTKGVVAALRKHRALQNAERLQAEEWTDLGLIFPGTHGQLKEGAVIVYALDRTLSRLGLPDVRVHDLRHTAATLWLEENKHPMGVKEFLGHADIGTTLGTYSHVTGKLMQEMADAMDTLLFGAS